MPSDKPTTSCYLELNGVKHPVIPEVYRAFRAENNHVRNRAKSEQRCAQQDYRYCNGDCLDCCWAVNEKTMSLESLEYGKPGRLPCTASFEDECISNIILQQVYAYADTLVKDGAEILKLRFDYCCSYRQIGACLGISSSSVGTHLRTILDHLRIHSKYFFEDCPSKRAFSHIS